MTILLVCHSRGINQMFATHAARSRTADTRDQAFQLLHTEVIFCCKQIGSGRTVLAHYIETLVELLKHEASIIHTAQSLATVVLRRLTVRGFVRFVTALLLGIVSGGEPWNGQGCGWLGLCLAVTW